MKQIALIVICAALTACTKQPPIQAKQEAGPLPVRVASVSTREIQRAIEAVGTLFPMEETIVSAEIEGPVTHVNADLGDQVAAGQVLVRISDEEQKYLLLQTEAQLMANLERLGLKNENERVKDVRETSEVRRAQADLFEAEQRYKRIRSLVDQGIGSRSELDQAQARWKSAQASYDQSINQIRNLIQEVERSKASLQLQRKKLRDTTVVAPHAARVKERQVTAGAFVRPNSPLFTLVKINPVRLRLEVPERMAPWVKVGQIARVEVEAFEGRQFSGRIWRISPTVEQSKRTFVVEALIDNPLGELKPGSYARARVPTDRRETIKLIPVRAVQYVFGTNKAYVVNNGTIDAREVKLGDRFAQDVEVLEGLTEGQQVATTNLARLDSGVRVSIATGPAEGAGRAQ